MKKQSLIESNNKSSGSSIESLLLQSYPNHSDDMAELINKFKSREFDIKELAHKLNETMGSRDYGEFISSQFNNFNSSLTSEATIKSLGVDISKINFTSISKTLSKSNKWRWSVLPFKVNSKSKLLNFGLKGWQYYYSRIPLLWWIANSKHYILSLSDFTLKRIHWYDELPPYPGMQWVKLIGGKIVQSGNSPQELKDHSATLISNHEIWVFGGKSSNIASNHSYILDVDFMHWHSIAYVDDSFVPVARHGHSAVLAQNSIYVFGGSDDNGNDFNDLHIIEIYSFPSELHK